MYKKLIVLFFLVFSLQASLQDPSQILAQMSLRQKIGQLFIVATTCNYDHLQERLASQKIACAYNLDPNYLEYLIQEYQIGGLIFLYQNSPSKQYELIKKYQSLSKTYLLIAQDCEWGLSMRHDSNLVVRYPHNLTLGAIQNLDLIYQLGYEIGRQCLAIGVHLNLAPVVDVNSNMQNPVIHDRSFGDNPNQVAQKATYWMKGLQAAGILACAKHFPGHGDTTIDSHLDLPVIYKNREQLNSVELIPFKALIQNGVDCIMLGHLKVETLDDTCQSVGLSQQVVTNFLQTELGFNGLKMTDGLGMQAVSKFYAPGDLEKQAFLAGHDLLLCPLDVPRAVDLIEELILTQQVSEQELDARVLKILKIKMQLLSEQPSNLAHQDLTHFLVRDAAYDLQAQAYRESLTAIYHDDQINFNHNLLPDSLVVQIGNLAQNYFYHKYLEIYHKEIFKFGADFLPNNLDFCLQQAQNFEQIIILVGDIKKQAQANFGISPNLLKLISQLALQNKKIIVILFGTPYSAKLFLQASAILVAFEDLAVVQQNVLDLLLGKFKPTGKMPVQI
jgi:beta-N-acetylhexosaminidase